MMHGKLPANIITAALDPFGGGGEEEGEEGEVCWVKKRKKKLQKAN